MDKQTLRHESIHIKQQEELCYRILFIVCFILVSCGLWLYRDAYIAYCPIPFEQEAYDQEHDPEYLNNRPFGLGEIIDEISSTRIENNDPTRIKKRAKRS